jgi:hypothetical protein
VSYLVSVCVLASAFDELYILCVILYQCICTPILFKISYIPHSQEDSSNNFSLQSFYILRVGIPYLNPVIYSYAVNNVHVKCTLCVGCCFFL